MNALLAGYIGLCAGFCIGMFAAAIFGAPRLRETDENTAVGYQPKRVNGPINPPPRQP